MHSFFSKLRLPGGEKIRFLLAGGFNTALTLALYWLLLLLGARYLFAYTLSFVLGIFTSYVLNTYLVFRAPWSWRKLALFPSVHLVNYLIGATIVWLWVSGLGLNAEVAPIVATLIIIPASFLMTRLLIKRDPKSDSEDRKT